MRHIFVGISRGSLGDTGIRHYAFIQDATACRDGRSMMEPEAEPEARVVVIGEPVDGHDALFVGGLDEARDYVLRLDEARRGEVAIVTEGRIYDPREL